MNAQEVKAKCSTALQRLCHLPGHSAYPPTDCHADLLAVFLINQVVHITYFRPHFPLRSPTLPSLSTVPDYYLPSKL